MEVQGKPDKVKWLKNGKAVDDSVVKEEDLGNGMYRMTIPNASENDAGEYSVQVTNEAGTSESSAKVEVQLGNHERNCFFVFFFCKLLLLIHSQLNKFYTLVKKKA